jgi:hypothetical protein
MIITLCRVCKFFVSGKTDNQTTRKIKTKTEEKQNFIEKWNSVIPSTLSSSGDGLFFVGRFADGRRQEKSSSMQHV